MSIEERKLENKETPPSTVTLKERKPWYTCFLSPLWLCLLLALLLRVWLLVHTSGVIDGDEALVGIQAERVLHGDFPVYFYGQAYMGVLEVYLIALIFAITGPSVWALRAEPILLSLLVVWLTWKLAAVLAEAAHVPPYARRYFMTIAALFAAVPPLYDAVIEMRTYGGYIETFLLMLLLLLSAFHLTRRWFAGASARELAWRWAGIGLLVGLGLWIYPLIAPAILAVGLWILLCCLNEIIKQRKLVAAGTPYSLGALLLPARKLLLVVAAIPTFILGFIPALLWGATHHWVNLTYILNLGGGGISRNKLRTIYHVTQAYASCVAPRLISGAVPLENATLTALHWPLVFFGMCCIVATVALIAISFFWRHPSLVRMRQLAGLPTLFAACTTLAFCTSSASVFVLYGCTNDDAGRYATPFMLSLPFFFATLFTVTSLYIYERNQLRTQNTQGIEQGRTPRAFLSRTGSRMTLILQGLLFLLLLFNLTTQTLTYELTDPGRTFQSNYCIIGPANNDPIVAYMQREHIHYFWGSNLLAYPLVFKANNTIIGADPLPLINPHIALNRIPSYTDAVLHADRPSMLVMVNHNDPHPLLLRLLDQRNVTYRTALFPSEPGFDILIVTPLSRTVSPLESKDFDIFYCYPH